MSNKKDIIINIMNELIPEICPEEQEIFELYSDAFYEEAISIDKRNKMGDDCYFGEASDPVSFFLLMALATVVVEQIYKGSGKYSWIKLRDHFSKKNHKNLKQDSNAELYATLIKVIEQKAKEEANSGQDSTSSASININISISGEEKVK